MRLVVLDSDVFSYVPLSSLCYGSWGSLGWDNLRSVQLRFGELNYDMTVPVSCVVLSSVQFGSVGFC